MLFTSLHFQPCSVKQTKNWTPNFSTCSFPSSITDGSHATLSRGCTCNFLLALATWHPQNCSATEVEGGIRELKQTDAAAERRRSTSKFYLEGLMAKWIQSALDIIHPLIEWRFEFDRLLSAAASVCLRSLLSQRFCCRTCPWLHTQHPRFAVLQLHKEVLEVLDCQCK